MFARPAGQPAGSALVLALVCSAVVALSGCGAVSDPGSVSPGPASSSPSAVSSPSAASSSTVVAIPADGVTLREFGFKNGPLDQFSVPRTTYLFSSADQPNNVTLIASFPSADDLLAYLRTSLPATGFTITADDPAVSTLTFTGHGWSGTVTAAPGHPTPGTTAATLAITLRPL